MRHFAVTVLGGALALGAVAACDGDSAGEGLSATSDPTSGPTPTPEVQSTAPDVPDCYPEDAPRPGGQVVSSISFSDDDAFVCTLSVEVGELAPAMDGYRSDLVANGWALAFDAPDTFAVTKDEFAMLVSGEPAGGSSTMSITVVPSALVAAIPTTVAAP